MKIGVISDTHGSLHFFEKAMDILKDCDRIIHAGDVLYHGPRNDLPGGYDPKGLAEKINTLSNIYIARGNCDSDVDQMVINHPLQTPGVLIEFNQKKFFVLHGYTDSKLSMIYKAKEINADFLILGHTHVKELFKDESLIVLNPGSTSLPKDGTRSCAIIDSKKIELWDIETKSILNSLNLN